MAAAPHTRSRSRNAAHVFGGGGEEIGSAKWCSTNALILCAAESAPVCWLLYGVLLSSGILDFLNPHSPGLIWLPSFDTTDKQILDANVAEPLYRLKTFLLSMEANAYFLSGEEGEEEDIMT